MDIELVPIKCVLKEKRYLNSRGVTCEVAEQPQIINKPCEDAHMTAKDCKQMQKFCRKPTTMSYKGFVSHSRVSKEDQEFYDLKNKAAEYYRSNGVPQKIESVLNEMFWQKPNDIYGYLVGQINILMLLRYDNCKR